ncbi:alpha-hydroxy acid oxidase [Sinorhizobium meliloti]|jgi:isopentenyl diphosphate isomerase/L-lactate dehydrogenase-like FMN-dependent dehydrogenase|uniref:(S)-2-hydroxy-acid oxidase n=1 Tax=Sinorhizobium meliloti (strain SM11) TaxID=707241 RepID=F7X2N0_SINMM|nr:alpha-hydroxy acid oxidase [Sinorhizobium meliloti]PST24840.1 alpha-hydroxy-acid oxidizing enzyme [Mesorhizobium loti]TWA90934.1 isopentenyl diphosphate isomerase/L-lactate dehydrogenase-like FMN-dependent dehydrogenase [Ensifer sp. SEMIA 134]TWB27431.1 isopentenyl diphosphate isomerase/L-lactate dehydrogenase-like FMN-dependent dehydrogenase [Ensifer sp. SEMIA 135]AEG05022.1 (S)-2-hydroxy-acid oxidase [Sinorhizobium meliloti BL225C]AEG53994.1 (S)-2-hydroxy-acid oxidase [Sinorhizobium melil
MSKGEEATCPPHLGDFESLQEIIQKAQGALSKEKWDSLVGGAETETTLKRNRLAIDSIAFKPRVLRNVSVVDLSIEHFGRRLRLPIFLAPTGPLNLFGPGGGAAVASGAQVFGVAHMLSSGCTPLESVAEAAPSALRMAQLYVRGDDASVHKYVGRALASGCAAICLTVDSAVLARRDRDIANRHRTAGLGKWPGQAYQAGLDWRTVKLIKDSYDIPLVLKGIATVEDARIAVDHGVDWIYVSNHGGRQLDHGRGTMDVLPEIIDAVGGQAKVMVDGGFCRGTDIIKALAIGANLVGLGRMQCYALAAGGEAAIIRMLELIEDEMLRSMALLGVPTIGDLDRSYLYPAVPVTIPSALSAFPLIN